MKTRNQIIIMVAAVIGLAALSSVTKRGGRSETGKCSGGACCPMLPGLNVWSTNAWTGSNHASTNSALAGSEATPKEQQQ